MIQIKNIHHQIGINAKSCQFLKTLAPFFTPEVTFNQCAFVYIPSSCQFQVAVLVTRVQHLPSVPALKLLHLSAVCFTKMSKKHY